MSTDWNVCVSLFDDEPTFCEHGRSTDEECFSCLAAEERRRDAVEKPDDS